MFSLWSKFEILIVKTKQGFRDGSLVKNCLQCRRLGLILGREDPLEKEMATHSSILAWEIPRTEEPDGLKSTGLQKSVFLSLKIA